jgi:hypothetical protein
MAAKASHGCLEEQLIRRAVRETLSPEEAQGATYRRYVSEWIDQPCASPGTHDMLNILQDVGYYCSTTLISRFFSAGQSFTHGAVTYRCSARQPNACE